MLQIGKLPQLQMRERITNSELYIFQVHNGLQLQEMIFYVILPLQVNRVQVEQRVPQGKMALRVLQERMEHRVLREQRVHQVLQVRV
jgi:hypothetical protein